MGGGSLLEEQSETVCARRTEWSVRDQAPIPPGPPRSGQLV